MCVGFGILANQVEWSFAVEKHDIGFHVELREEIDTVNGAATATELGIVDGVKVASGSLAKGSWTMAKGNGTVMVVWDNKYSWMTAKIVRKSECACARTLV